MTYKIISSQGSEVALTMRQALYLSDQTKETVTIVLPDGCELDYTGPRGDVTCKLPTPISIATPFQASLLFTFFFEAVADGKLDLTKDPQIKNLHDYLITKRQPQC